MNIVEREAKKMIRRELEPLGVTPKFIQSHNGRIKTTLFKPGKPSPSFYWSVASNDRNVIRAINADLKRTLKDMGLIERKRKPIGTLGEKILEQAAKTIKPLPTPVAKAPEPDLEPEDDDGQEAMLPAEPELLCPDAIAAQIKLNGVNGNASQHAEPKQRRTMEDVTTIIEPQIGGFVNANGHTNGSGRIAADNDRGIAPAKPKRTRLTNDEIIGMATIMAGAGKRVDGVWVYYEGWSDQRVAAEMGSANPNITPQRIAQQRKDSRHYGRMACEIKVPVAVLTASASSQAALEARVVALEARLVTLEAMCATLEGCIVGPKR